MTRILQVNGAARLRRRIVDLVAEFREFALVGEATGRKEALASLAHRPDLVLLSLGADLRQPSVLLRELAARQPGIRILLLCPAFTPAHRTLCRAPRVRGLVSSNCPDAELRLALSEVAAGREYWSAKCLNNLSHLNWLGRRESDILHLVATGLPYQRIATELGIAPSTVKTYARRLRNRFGVGGRNQLRLAAVRRGLLPTASHGLARQPDSGTPASSPRPDFSFDARTGCPHRLSHPEPRLT